MKTRKKPLTYRQNLKDTVYYAGSLKLTHITERSYI